MFEFGSDIPTREPIHQQPAFGRDEVKEDIERLVSSFDGPELVNRLTEYVMLSVVEVYLLRDKHPEPLITMKGTKVEVIAHLNPAQEAGMPEDGE